MSFAQFLRTFHEKLRPQRKKAYSEAIRKSEGKLGPNEPGYLVKGALDYVFGVCRAQLDSYLPSQAKTREFIQDLQFAITEEKKLLSQDRILALGKVFSYNEMPGQSYFPGINPSVFAFQLALRIREPSLIDQRGIGICGENALMIFFAKNTPSAFAEYAVSLMRTGTGRFLGLPVSPSAQTFWGASIWELNEKKFGKNNLAEADFVTLASLAKSLFGTIESLASPEEMVGQLSKAGFLKVRNKLLQTLLDENIPYSPATNLKEAAAAVADGKIVILGVHAQWIKVLRELKIGWSNYFFDSYLLRGSGKKWNSPTGRGIKSGDSVQARKSGEARHWILVTYLKLTATDVTIKLYSWGNPLQATLPLKLFLSYYLGYVAADPPKKSN